MSETYLPLATGEGDVHEAAGVYEPLPGAALGDLLLLLGLNLHAEIPCQPLFRILSSSFPGSGMFRILRRARVDDGGALLRRLSRVVRFD